jgi:hypothetical protein
VSAAKLQDGIVFVDTPGLGSLATSGAAETLAYLPRCDLAVVLIDAASTLTDDDLRTLHRLQQAAIPAMVVLSKADLLGAADRDRALAYTSERVSAELGLQIGAHAVSTMAGHEHLLDKWIGEELRPLLAQHRELARKSVHRKIGALRAGVEATPRAHTKHREEGASLQVDAESATVEQELRTASGAFDEVRRAVDAIGDTQYADLESALRRSSVIVAETLLSSPTLSSPSAVVTGALIRVSGEQAEQLARVLAALADDSRRILAKSARALNLPEPATDDEWTTLLRELPQLDVGDLVIELRLPMLSALGRRVANARVYQSLRRQAGLQIGGTLETHARLLRSWGLRVLARLRQQFDAQAQIYRAQLGGGSPTGAPARDTERALHELEALAGAT